MEENIKILEGYLDRNTQLFEDYGEKAIIQNKEIQALENIIKGYRKLEEELERQREINTIINKQNLDDNYERALEKTMTKFLNENIENDYIPKSKVKEKIDYYIGMYEIGKLHEDEASKHQMEAIVSIINDLQELMEE